MNWSLKFILQGDVLRLTYRGHRQSSDGGTLYCFAAEKHLFEEIEEAEELSSTSDEVSDQELQTEDDEAAMELQLEPQSQPSFSIEFMSVPKNGFIFLNTRLMESLSDATDIPLPLEEGVRCGLAKIFSDNL